MEAWPSLVLLLPPLKWVSCYHAILFTESMGVFSPTVGSILFTVASVVSLHFLYLTLLSNFSSGSLEFTVKPFSCPIMNTFPFVSHIQVVALLFFNFFYRAWRISGHGETPVRLFEKQKFRGSTLCYRVLWGILRWNYTSGRTSSSSQYVHPAFYIYFVTKIFDCLS